MAEYVILVDKNDNPVGRAEKIQAHKQGLLHRAFSIFVFSPDMKKLLIQRRNPHKYHSGGLWANTTCSHPRPGEELETAAHRRLQEEMGFDTALTHIGSFIYKANFDNGLTEYELDHLFTGTYDGPVHPDPSEVSDYRWEDIDFLAKDLKDNPQKYAYWFRIAFPKVMEWLDKRNQRPL